MSFEAILNNISKHVQLNPQEVAAFTSRLKAKELPKGAVLLKQNSSCHDIYFVNHGILRAYFLSPKGKETTIMFAIKDWWITDMHAFTHQKKSLLTIETLEASTVWSLSKTDLEQLFVEIPKLERFFRILMQNAYIREQLRGLENLSLPAKKKYALFIEKYPDVAQLVSQKQIASYLGITPEFLSVIRSGT